ncbi:MAG: alpha-E domain-containing protein, partial [Bacillus sp. (in: firmicutes)]
ILDYITFNRNYENSNRCGLERARHNVRTVRDQLPSKVWDTINSFYLWLGEQGDQRGDGYLPYSFYEQIRNHVLLFQGVTESMMLRDNAWNFFQTGRYIERSGNTIRTLQMICDLLVEGRTLGHVKDDYHRLLTILESVDGIEAFRRCYADDVTIDNIAEFLVVNKNFPRSVLFSVNSLEMYIKRIQSDLDMEGYSKLNRRLGAIRLNFLAHDNFGDLTMGQHISYLNELLINGEQIGVEIGACFFYENGGEYQESTQQRKVAAI